MARPMDTLDWLGVVIAAVMVAITLGLLIWAAS